MTSLDSRSAVQEDQPADAGVPQTDDLCQAGTRPAKTGRALGVIARVVIGVRVRVFALNDLLVLAVSLTAQFVLVREDILNGLAAYAIATVLGLEANFLFSRYLTWADRRRAFFTALGRFNAERVVIAVLGIALFFEFNTFRVNEFVANVVISAVLAPGSFLMSRSRPVVRSASAQARLEALPRQPAPAPPAAPAVVARPVAVTPVEPETEVPEVEVMTERSWWQRVTAVPPARMLCVILIVQAALSARLIWTNTAFQDEALYLWAGRMEWAHWLHGAAVPDYATYFSGAPAIYPALSALANGIGGLPAARALSLLFMLAATVLLYDTARRLFDRRTAVASAALFAVFGAGDQLGAFATYDAMAVCLTAFAAWLVVCSSESKMSEPYLVGAAAVMALADATKYASALWNPVIVAMAVLLANHCGWRSRLSLALRFAFYTVIPVVIALYAASPAYWHGVTWTTLDRQVISVTAPLRVLDIAWGWMALLALLAVLGVWLSWYERERAWGLPVVLLAAGFLAPLEQARISDITSLHKHVVFGAWFLVMMAGYAVSRISYLDGRLAQGAIIGGVLFGALAVTGVGQASSFATSWPSTRSAMTALTASVRQVNGPCLVFQEDAAYYYLPPDETRSGIVGPYTFSYPDPASQRLMSRFPAMAAAIAHGYFGTVEVDASQGDPAYRLLVGALRHSGLYVLVSSEPWPLHPGEPTQVWRLAEGEGR